MKRNKLKDFIKRKIIEGKLKLCDEIEERFKATCLKKDQIFLNYSDFIQLMFEIESEVVGRKW